MRWIVFVQFSMVMAQAFTNRPVDHQRKILAQMMWPRDRATLPPEEDTATPEAVVIPAATFSRQMVIRFPASGAIRPAERKPPPVPSAGYDPFAAGESADYSLGSYVSLSLASGGSDAEGAEQNWRRLSTKNGKSFGASQLDLLQQLLRLAPSSAEGGHPSGKCADPFHSWMCGVDDDDATAATAAAAAPSTLAPPDFRLAPEFQTVQPISIPDRSPTVVPPLPAPPVLPVQSAAPDAWAGMDPCHHPFHSWMCADRRLASALPPAPSKQSAASAVDENLLLLPSAEPTTAKPLTTTAAPPAATPTQHSGWDGADPCTHPFHSWLCGKRPPMADRRTVRPLPAPATTGQPFVPAASFLDADVHPAAAPATVTQPPPPTTSVPLLIRTLTTAKKGWNEADSCSHPFHSWLCETPKIRTTSLPPATTTTTRPALPPPEEAVVFEPAPSMEEANQLVADAFPAAPLTMATTTTTTTTTTMKTTLMTTIEPIQSSGWDEADSCSHPFHSWLCAKLPVKTRTPRPPTTTAPPLPAASPLPDASNFEALDALPLPAPQIDATQEPAVARTIPTEPSGWAEGADPCSHPFHSWLCKRSPSVGQNLRPMLRTGRQSGTAVQSESEAQDEENLESSRWSKFESLRLSPSSVVRQKY